MRKSAFAIAVLLLAGCAASPGNKAVPVSLEVPRLDAGGTRNAAREGGVDFERTPARVGDKTRTTVQAHATWTDFINGTAAHESLYDSEYVVEVLAVEAGAPTRVRIRVEKNQTRHDDDHVEPTSLQGNAYVVSVAAPHVVRDGATTAPSEDESQRLDDILPDLGTRTQIDQVLPDRSMQVGERRDGLATAITRILHPRYWTLTQGSARLEKADEQFATLAVTIEASSANSGIGIDVKGKAWLRRRGARLEGLDLDGTYRHPPADSGSFRLRRRVTDER